jgi:hypothetical protein
MHLLTTTLLFVLLLLAYCCYKGNHRKHTVPHATASIRHSTNQCCVLVATQYCTAALSTHLLLQPSSTSISSTVLVQIAAATEQQAAARNVHTAVHSKLSTLHLQLQLLLLQQLLLQLLLLLRLFVACALLVASLVSVNNSAIFLESTWLATAATTLAFTASTL